MKTKLVTYETITDTGPILCAGGQKQQDLFYGSMKLGDQIEITRQKRYPKKTHAQCRMYFGLLVRTVVETMNDRGWTITKECNGYKAEIVANAEDIKDLLYGLFAIKKDGKLLTISRMTTIDMTEFYERCADGLAVEPWFIYIQPPNQNWRKNANPT